MVASKNRSCCNVLIRTAQSFLVQRRAKKNKTPTTMKMFLCSSVALDGGFWIWLLIVTKIVPKSLNWHYKNVIGSLGILYTDCPIMLSFKTFSLQQTHGFIKPSIGCVSVEWPFILITLSTTRSSKNSGLRQTKLFSSLQALPAASV